MTPDQPGSAPSKRVSAASVLQLVVNHGLSTLNEADEQTTMRALRLLVRVEQEEAERDHLFEARRKGAMNDWNLRLTYAQADGIMTFLKDLAALVAPTDAEEKAHE